MSIYSRACARLLLLFLLLLFLLLKNYVVEKEKCGRQLAKT